MENLLSIVIPFYNFGAMTVRCLRSIEFCTKMPYEVVLVDNGSDFNEFLLVQKFAEHSKKKYKIVRMGSNLGFVYGTNAGIAESSGNIIILLNNDTVVSNNWDTELSSPLLKSAEFGLSGPISDSKIGWQNPVNINKIWKVGIPPYRQALDYNEYAKELQGKFLGKVLEIPSGPISFFCAAIKREVFEKVGLLDISFGMGIGDDDEFCIRARRAGYKLGLCLGSFVAHKHRTTFDALQLSVPSLRFANLEKLRKL